MIRRSVILRAFLLMLLAAAFACKAAPRTRPVEGADVDEGPGSLVAARKYLEGRWNLESLEVFPPGRPPVTLNVSGTLSYDEFGNLRMEIRPDEKAADVLRAAGVELQDGGISSSGRTVVDMQHRTLTYVLEGQPPGRPPTGPLSPSRPRHWEVTGDTLTLTTKDDAGKPLTVGRWKRMP
jgi:hypothetical protein